MKIGKLPTDVLKKHILDNIKIKRPEVMVHSGIGEDCSVIDFGEKCCVLSSDPITGSGRNIGKLAVHINCNDIAASGVEPFGILVTILAPETAKEQEIFSLMDEINSTAAELNIEVLGGHTEITRAVNKMVVSVTAIGRGPVDGYVSSSGARNGDYIIATKYAGLEGTSILAGDYEDYLKDKVSSAVIESSKKYINMISVIKEGVIGGRLKATSMHDATEGGLLGALWEIAEASGKGFEIYRELIPITSETADICSVFEINPLRLISSGMMLITIKDKDTLLEALSHEGINAACIGKIVEDPGRKVLISGDEEENVEPPQNDELFNIKL